MAKKEKKKNIDKNNIDKNNVDKTLEEPVEKKTIGRKNKINWRKLWLRRLMDNLKKDESNYPIFRDYNFYTNGYATFSRKNYITFYYTIDSYPMEIPIDFQDNIRKEARAGVRVSFLSVFEPTRIDWSSPRIASKLRTWKTIDEDLEDVDEYNYQKNIEALDNTTWRKRSLLYLSDAEKRRKRKLFRYRSMLIVSGYRGEKFDRTIFEINEYCKNVGIGITRIDDSIFDYLRFYSPFSLENSESVKKHVGSNTITDEMLARFSGYDQGKIGDSGIYWGSDIYSGFPVFKVVKKSEVDAENILITAETGGGKSYFLKVLLVQLLAKPQYNGTINDIEGFEYIPLANFVANNDKVVILNMAEGQGCYFDPVEINMTGDPELDREMFSFSNSFTLAITKTLIGKNVLKDDWANIVINNAVSKVYSDAGVEVDDIDTWKRSKGLTLFDVYRTFKDLYTESIDLIARYGYSNASTGVAGESSLELTEQYRRNVKYKEALDLVIAKLSVYFEDLEHGGTRSNVFSKRVTLEDISKAKLVICSFGMAGKSASSVDPIQMGLAQLSASNISHIRSIFSKASGKFNFKVWEEFQRWGSFPDADVAIKTALTGGRKLGDINLIITNYVKELLDDDKFGVFDNITSFAIGAIGDDDTRDELCRRLSVPLLKVELDNLVVKKGNTETFAKDDEVASMYDKAFLVHLDKSVSTIVKMSIPEYLSKSPIFRTGVNLQG